MCEHRLPPMLLLHQGGFGAGRDGNGGRVYRRIPYPALVSGYGLPPVLDNCGFLLQGRLTAVCGPSGVGKSTLLNAVLTGRKLFMTQALSGKSGAAEMRRAIQAISPEDDTRHGYAGVSAASNYVPNEFAELAAGFKEIRERSGDCRFSCSHLQEPHCTVRAVAAVKSWAAGIDRIVLWRRNGKKKNTDDSSGTFVIVRRFFRSARRNCNAWRRQARILFIWI